MGIDNSNIQRISAFYHALGKVLTESGNSIGGELYKSAHNVSSKEIWVDSIAVSDTYGEAAAEAANNDAVTLIGTNNAAARMYPLQGSNYQTWFFDTGTPTVSITGCIPSDGWVKPFINPSDVPAASGAPSNGYELAMFRPNGQPVNYFTTFWDVDYYAGLIKFQVGSTPADAGSNLGFTTTALNGTNTASLGALQTMLDNSTTGGPHGYVFQYTGQLLDDFLENIPSGGGGGSGSDEWQSSVNGYFIEVGDNSTVGGQGNLDDQIAYLNTIYDNYFIKTDDALIMPQDWPDINAPNSYYEFDGASFSAYTLTTNDDANRFLLVENTIELDVIEISATGSVSEFPSTTVLADRILEYTGPSASGLTYSAWQVTDPRLGMVTTLDNQESTMIRYIGSGWVEFAYELTYKVNSQKNMEALTTTTDYDQAINATVSFEPSGDKSIDVLLNGVQMPTDVYIFGGSSAMSGTYSTPSGTQYQDPNVPEVYFNTGTPVSYSVGDFVNITTSTTTYTRQITLWYNHAGSDYTIEYSGVGIPNIIELSLFKQVQRTNGVARKGDNLLWIGSNWYELSGTAPKDLITFNYVTRDPGALNS